MNSKVATSESHPIYANFLHADERNAEFFQKHGGVKIGMTLCPGKTQQQSMTGFSWQRNLTKDLRLLKEKYNTDVLVSIMSRGDFTALKVPNLQEEARKIGMQSFHYDMYDSCNPKRLGKVAGQDAVQVWTELVTEVSRLAAQGKVIVVHCMGGLNRTGCFIWCMLKQLYGDVMDKRTPQGTSHSKNPLALSMMKRVRKASGGNASQQQFAKQWTPALPAMMVNQSGAKTCEADEKVEGDGQTLEWAYGKGGIYIEGRAICVNLQEVLGSEMARKDRRAHMTVLFRKSGFNQEECDQVGAATAEYMKQREDKPLSFTMSRWGRSSNLIHGELHDFNLFMREKFKGIFKGLGDSRKPHVSLR